MLDIRQGDIEQICAFAAKQGLGDFTPVGEHGITELSGGRRKSNYRWHTASGDYVVSVDKVPVDAQTLAKYHHTNILREDGFPIPEQYGPYSSLSGGRNFSITRFVESTMAENMTKAQIEELAGYIGKLHRDYKDNARQFDNLETNWGTNHLLKSVRVKGAQLAVVVASDKPFTNMSRIAGSIGADRKIRKLAQTELLPTGMIHSDLNKRNILLKPDGHIALIDWDGMGHSTFLHEMTIATLSCALRSEPEPHFSGEHAMAFLKAYNKVRPITPQEAQPLQDMISLQMYRDRISLIKWFDKPSKTADGERLSDQARDWAKNTDLAAELGIEMPERGRGR